MGWVEDAWDISGKKDVVRGSKINRCPIKAMFLTESELVESPCQAAAGRAIMPVVLCAKVAPQDSP